MHFLRTPQRPQHRGRDSASHDGLPIGCLWPVCGGTDLRDTWDGAFGRLKFQTDFYIDVASFFSCSLSLFSSFSYPQPPRCTSTPDNIAVRFDFVMDTLGIISSPMSILYDRHIVSWDTTCRRGSFRATIFSVFFWRSVSQIQVYEIFMKRISG